MNNTLLTPTAPALLTQINATFNSLQTLMCNLVQRWVDESEFEDLNDYALAIQKHLPENFKVVKMQKRPFGFHFTVRETGAVYKITIAARKYAWARVS